jgi:hypothetical protein
MAATGGAVFVGSAVLAGGAVLAGVDILQQNTVFDKKRGPAVGASISNPMAV